MKDLGGDYIGHKGQATYDLVSMHYEAIEKIIVVWRTSSMENQFP
jgi:hypothetical protein